MSGLTPSAVTLANVVEEMDELDREYTTLEAQHNEYSNQVQKMVEHQQKVMKGVNHQRYRAGQISKSIKRMKPVVHGDDKKELANLRLRLDKKKAHIRELDQTLPHDKGHYLNLILGPLSVSILGKNNKYAYRNEYEQFKLSMSSILSVYCFVAYFFFQHPIADTIFHFLVLWYYCTLTIRESILKVNGSRIRGWWIIHHFICTFAAGVFITWPNGESYQAFRSQLLVFGFYLGIVTFAQYYFQVRTLYILHALGEREHHKYDMDITVEGFQSWQFRGLTTLLPWIFVGYAMQLYCAYKLYLISEKPDCKEWQVLTMAVIFAFLFAGNVMTVLNVMKKKFFGGNRIRAA